MGLDMYLKKGKRIPGKSIKEIEEIENKICYGDNKELLDEYKDYVTEIYYKSIDTTSYYLINEIGYWRKANAIHNWFVNNIQNGIDDSEIYEVKKEQLEKLLNTCKQVLEKSVLVDGEVVDTTLAKKLLPIREGFFFGYTNYDKWYIESLEKTVKQLERILKETDFEKYYVVYTSNW